MQDAQGSLDRRGVFLLDAPSPSVCLLIQLEKAATEEGGVTPSVYSRKEPVHLAEKEKQKLQVWSRIMPYKESFAWAMIPLFEAYFRWKSQPLLKWKLSYCRDIKPKQSEGKLYRGLPPRSKTEST
ncbi:guanine nucleotide exchange factor SPIKE 1-like [Miscanthus floridulus]|uniref:guanine nucleotide exchange factor SPIKE 1-like n=1 Tax=Miscanthus floridulus TaxID=154761 RepID=UPI0034583012